MQRQSPGLRVPEYLRALYRENDIVGGPPCAKLLAGLPKNTGNFCAPSEWRTLISV
jgi:hypothetical protein